MFSLQTTSRKKWLIILLPILLTGIFCTQITLREDALDLLPDNVLTTDMHLFQQMGIINRIYLNVRLKDTTGPVSIEQWQALKKSVLQIGGLLKQEELLGNIIYRLPQGYELAFMKQLWQRLPTLLDEEDYLDIEKIISEDGLRQKMASNFQTLNSPAGFALKQQIINDPLGLSLIAAKKFQKTRGEFSVKIKDGLFTSNNGSSCLIWLDSLVSLTDSEQAFQVQERISNALEHGLTTGVEVDIIGTLPHTLENIKTINKDLKYLLPLATVCLAVFLYYSLNGYKAFLVLCIPFFAAPPAIALLNIFYPDISALALGFGIVLIGLAVDFAVHIYLALCLELATPANILRQLKRPVTMAWCTTCGVFVILLSSSVSSHRQMALLAIGGISFAVLISWQLIPTIAKKFPIKKQTPSSCYKKTSLPPLILIGSWIVLLLAGIFTWPQLRYNGDLQVLDVSSDTIAKADATFHETWRQDKEQAFILAAGANIGQALNKNDLISDYLKNNLQLPLYSASPILPGPITRVERLKLWQNFWNKHQIQLATRIDKIGGELGFSPGSFTPFFEYIQKKPQDINELQVLNGVLHPLLASMVRTIPKDYQDKNIAAVVMSITPLDPDSWTSLLKLEKKYTDVFLISTLKWRENVEYFLRTDITRLSMIAGIFILVLTGFAFRNVRQVIAALAPVGSALASMSVYDYITGQDLNLMHVLMGLMVIGLSVDYGIFSVCAYKKSVSSATQKAISTCAVSSCIGFGVLSLASHPALQALGITVLIGIGLAWPTALWVTPAIMQIRSNDA